MGVIKCGATGIIIELVGLFQYGAWLRLSDVVGGIRGGVCRLGFLAAQLRIGVKGVQRLG